MPAMPDSSPRPFQRRTASHPGVPSAALLFVFLATPPALAGAEAAGLIPRFELSSDGPLISQAARTGRFYDVVGRRAALFGTEGEGFEAWIYPLKLLHECRIRGLVSGTDESADLSTRLEWVQVRPHSLTLTSTHSRFTVRQILYTPLDVEGAVILLDVETSRPLTLTVSFVPDLRPMWPAGLGGQYASWSEQRRLFVISESRRKYNGLIGSPAAVRGSSTLAHEFAKGSMSFEIPVDPETARRFYYPLIIAGGQNGRDAVFETYDRLLGSVRQEYSQMAAHCRTLRENQLSVQTPDPDLDASVEWAKLSLDRGFVRNPDLGSGLIAGWGHSGESARPGFGWFFGGDTFLNQFAIAGYGDFESVKTAIRFLQKRQRADGKMMHELTQAAAWLKWFEEYPYGYYHGDTTPFYITAFGDFLLRSGDRGFLKESWESLRRAYEYCKSTDEDGDGLMDNTRAGLGASELGSLLEGLKTDILLGALSPAAWRAMSEMAGLMGDSRIRDEASALEEKALSSANVKFWDPEMNTLIHALAVTGARNRERTAWPSLGIMLGVFNPGYADATVEMLGSSALSADWGTRMLARTSSAYDPAAYNNGAVWPFLTGLASTAAYVRHYPAIGYPLLMANARLTWIGSLGNHPELVSGDFYRTVETAVPHQLFSSGGVITPLVRGMFGLEGDALNRTLRFAPHFPPHWNRAAISRYRIGDERIDITYVRGVGKSSYRIRGGAGTRVLLSAPLGILSTVSRVSAGEKDSPFRLVETPGDTHCEVETKLDGDTSIEIYHSGGVELAPESQPPLPGDSSRALRVLATRREGNSISVELEGLSEQKYTLRVFTDRKLGEVRGGEIRGSEIAVRMPRSDTGGWVRHRLEMR